MRDRHIEELQAQARARDDELEVSHLSVALKCRVSLQNVDER